MPIRALLFDLDGTLIDTAPEIADALNATLAACSLPAVPEATARGWIGDGARVLLSRAFAHLKADDMLLADAWQRFEAEYFARLGTRSWLFPGVVECLDRLAACGTKTAVLTNKEGRFATKLLQRHGIASRFDIVVAGDTLPVKKPDPAVVRHALDRLGGVPADEAALVGDSLTDLRTARAAGVSSWIVGHGYPQGSFAGEHRPDRFIAGFHEL